MNKIITTLVTAVFLVAVTFGTTACLPKYVNYGLDAAKVGIDTKTLSDNYKEVEDTLRFIQDNQEVFSNEDWRKLSNVDAIIDMLIVDFDDMNGKDVSKINPEDIKYMWGLAKNGYKQAKEVITTRWGSLDGPSKILLKTFDRKAGYTSDNIEALLNNPDYVDINKSITLISGVLGLTIKMLGVL